MLINKTKRIITTAFKDLSRNIWLNMVTIIIIVIALFTITTMLAVDKIGGYALNTLQEKIDISIQFKDDASEEKILELKEDLEDLEEVRIVEYISKEQALINFKEAHKNNEYIDQSLEELGENPLFAVLNVKAKSLEQYGAIDDYINNNENYQDIIESVNFKENERAINNFSGILKTVKDGIFGLTALFILISIMIAFNTIRLAMYTHKMEIEIMRLVGASNWFIKMPFIVEGAIFGIIGCAITFAFIFPVVMYISPKVSQFLPGFDLQNYFMNDFPRIAGVLLISGMALGVISSLIAIRRYLKI
ncbi:MAG: permease-like cell division protein FtsX [Patescibacteria group bacterium]|nr:permease-like cell division protein FtsX [Patescibacteria group bacterium]